MDTIFHITGGLGKHVLSTAVINSYKDFHPDENLIVSCAYPSVFDGNENVSECLQLGNTQYFYKNYIKNKNIKVFAQEPYKQTTHISKQSHLIDTWCDMVGVKYTKEPSLFLNYRVTEITRKQMFNFSNKPILLFQPFGGNDQNMPYCWARDIHPNIAQNIVDLLKEKYNIIHICNEYHPDLKDCIRIQDRLSFQTLINIVDISHRRIFIDSSLQHIANVLGKKSMVIWNVTSPKQFGYSLHDNIVSKFDYDDGYRGSYFFNYEIGGIPEECPADNFEEMYDLDFIYKYLENNF